MALPLATETGSTQLDIIRPGETVAFVLLFPSAPPDYRQYQVLVLSGVPLPAENHYTTDLLVTDLQQEATGSNMYRIVGRLVNQGTTAVEKLRLLVTAYDDQGRVVSVSPAGHVRRGTPGRGGCPLRRRLAFRRHRCGHLLREAAGAHGTIGKVYLREETSHVDSEDGVQGIRLDNQGRDQSSVPGGNSRARRIC